MAKYIRPNPLKNTVTRHFAMKLSTSARVDFYWFERQTRACSWALGRYRGGGVMPQQNRRSTSGASSQASPPAQVLPPLLYLTPYGIPRWLRLRRLLPPLVYPPCGILPLLPCGILSVGGYSGEPQRYSRVGSRRHRWRNGPAQTAKLGIDALTCMVSAV